MSNKVETAFVYFHWTTNFKKYYLFYWVWISEVKEFPGRGTSHARYWITSCVLSYSSLGLLLLCLKIYILSKLSIGKQKSKLVLDLYFIFFCLFLLFLYLYFKKSFQFGNDHFFKEMINTSIDWASLVAQIVKSLPVMQETWVQSLGWEDPLEKGKATHSSILTWRIL